MDAGATNWTSPTGLNVLRRRVGANLRSRNPDHRAAVLAWLRQWGCRGLDLASQATSSQALQAWADTWVCPTS